MNQINLGFRPVGARVLVSLNGEPVATVDWMAAKECAIEIKVCANSSIDGRVSYVLQTDGRPLAMDLEKIVAYEVSAALHHAGAIAEEVAANEKLTKDAALFIRMGAPFGMAQNPAIKSQAWTDAQWDSALRKFPLRGIPSQERVGVPKIMNHLPKEKIN